LVQPAFGQPKDNGASTAQRAADKLGELRDLTLDALIDRLPRVGAEGCYDEKVREWVPVPEAMEMARRLATGTELTPTQWKRALTKTGVVFFRSRWPSGEPYEVSMRDSFWLSLCRIRMTPREKGLRPLEGGDRLPNMCGNGTQWRQQAQMHQVLGRLEAGEHRLTFDVEIERGERANAWIKDLPRAPEGVVWKGELSFDVAVVATLAEALPPVDTPEMNKAVMECFGLCAAPWGGGGSKESVLVFDADTKSHPKLATAAVSAQVQLLRDGEVKSQFPMVVHRYDSLLSGNSIFDGPVKLFSFATLGSLPPDKLSDKDEVSHWKLRVSGTEKDVLKLWHAEAVWTGTIELPFAEVIERERARMKGKPERMFVWMP
jgi:hypothetical protein